MNLLISDQLIHGSSSKMTKMEIISTIFAKLINFEISGNQHMYVRPDLNLVFNIMVNIFLGKVTKLPYPGACKSVIC